MEDWAEYTTVARKYEVKIADYRHRTTNKARSKLKKKNSLTFSYFASRMSFEKVRNALVYSLVDEIIDEEEFVLLFDAYKSVIHHIYTGSTIVFVSTPLTQVNV